jgi:hypothetical protein
MGAILLLYAIARKSVRAYPTARPDKEGERPQWTLLVVD